MWLCAKPSTCAHWVCVSLGIFVLTFIPVVDVSADNKFPLDEVSSGVFVHYGKHLVLQDAPDGAIANIGFIVGQESVAVIDPGGSPAQGKALRDAIGTVTDLPVSHVILTHVHPDHMFGGIAFDEVPTIVAHANYSQAIAQRGQFYLDRFAGLFVDVTGPKLLSPTLLVDKVVEIDLGDRSLQINAHSTAHTDNDLTVLDKTTRTLWTSDLLFVERTPSLDGSLTGWLDVMDKLALLPADLIIPGHGKAGAWDELSMPQYTYLGALLHDTRQHIADNVRLADVIEQAEATQQSQWALFDFQHPTNITKAYTELEWE